MVLVSNFGEIIEELLWSSSPSAHLFLKHDPCQTLKDPKYLKYRILLVQFGAKLAFNCRSDPSAKMTNKKKAL
jgi:hypothetical protein